MERFYVGKCPKCGMEIYSDNGMAARFCTHCGAELTSNANNGGMAVAYMEKEETAKKDERKTVETASTYADAQSSTLQFDTSIPKFDVSNASGMYDFQQEMVNEKNRKRAVYVAGGIAAAIIGIAALGFTSGVANIHTEPTAPIVTEVPSDPDIDLVEDTTVEEPSSEEVQTDNKTTVTNIDDLTIPEKEAVRRASQLLTSIPYSKTELIETMQEEYYGFSESEATAAVEYMENAGLVNFKEEAARWAKTLAEDTSFSRAELLRMLSGEYSSHYTREEAEYAVNYIEQNNLVDWNEMAKKEAELYLSLSSKYTREELINQLVVGNEFTQSEAEYAANALGY
ncbi:Ltp family lipoprotein [Butyrivibrio sp. LC3010]|uniref:Ltp family lipoprotein n=1 Tax=Butyrivibrio sp. LC3010 TaxID=1280680 RepID=UPI00040D3693|nr:Ltp family lipoprotein [Butyrivibrio sp. LC3010]